MARRVTRLSMEQKLMHRWWTRIVLALAFLGLGYGFISLALNSGSLIEYAIGIVFLYWGFAHIVRGIRYAFAR
jgi:uncharacterized membrane protein HdeD (DUF308 family)